MQKPPVPANEVERIKSLYNLKILDTPNEQVFDDLTKLAAQLTGSRLALDQTPVARLLRGETLNDQQMIIQANCLPQRIVTCSGDFLYDVDGQQSGTVVVMNDITLQKSMEKMKDELVSTISH